MEQTDIEKLLEAKLNTIEMQFDLHDEKLATIRERFSGMDKAIELAAKEKDLSELRKDVKEDRLTALKSDSIEDLRSRVDAIFIWKEKAIVQFSLLESKYMNRITIAMVLSALSAIISLVGIFLI